MEIVIFDYVSTRCDLDIEESELIFLYDSLPHENTQPYQVVFKMAKRFRRYINWTKSDPRTDRLMDGQTDKCDSNIPHPCLWGGGGGRYKNRDKEKKLAPFGQNLHWSKGLFQNRPFLEWIQFFVLSAMSMKQRL